MCKVQWLANDHAGVNRKPFTEGDYEKLVDAVELVQSAGQEDLFDEAGNLRAVSRSQCSYGDSSLSDYWQVL
jgi:hypothetical protein